jgi:succinate dehydrogenase/fumarate reductase-like Fe-S protein
VLPDARGCIQVTAVVDAGECFHRGADFSSATALATFLYFVIDEADESSASRKPASTPLNGPG